MTYNKFDFLNRDCKAEKHNDCRGKWNGLGFEVFCYCSCHSKEEGEVSAWVEGPRANATDRTDAVFITQTGDHNGDN